MPRKELLVAGFRHVGRVLKGVKARRAAAAAAATGRQRLHTSEWWWVVQAAIALMLGCARSARLAWTPQSSLGLLVEPQPALPPIHSIARPLASTHAAPAVPAKAGGTAPTSKSAVAQQLKQRGGREAPSFAASGGSAAAAGAPGTSGVFGSLLKSAAAAVHPASAQTQPSPSFAAAPLWGKSAAAAQQEPAAASGVRAAAAAAASVAGTAAPKVASSVAANPLWRWAQLGASQEQPVKPAEPQQLQAALRSYARLDGGPTKKAAPPAPAKTAAALLRYAKLAKK